jgi:hypothetical protein
VCVETKHRSKLGGERPLTIIVSVKINDGSSWRRTAPAPGESARHRAVSVSTVGQALSHGFARADPPLVLDGPRMGCRQRLVNAGLRRLVALVGLVTRQLLPSGKNKGSEPVPTATALPKDGTRD